MTPSPRFGVHLYFYDSGWIAECPNLGLQDYGKSLKEALDGIADQIRIAVIKDVQEHLLITPSDLENHYIPRLRYLQGLKETE